MALISAFGRPFASRVSWLMTDCAVECTVSLSVLFNILNLPGRIAQSLQGLGLRFGFTILKYPPPASFLNFTKPKSGSTPVVSQSMTNPIVP